MTDSPFKYDAAISFLAEDEPLAISIADLLRDRFEVFVYSERQKDLAGKDGFKEFSAVFGCRSRVCVVLFRDGWGKTKWTRVEESAITERALEKGWEFLVVVALDSSGAPPWLPKTKIWMSYERFGIEGAASVIDARIQETAGIARDESARERAERLAREAAAEKQRQAFLGSKDGVVAAETEVDKLFSYLKVEIESIGELPQMVSIGFQRFDRFRAAIVTQHASITFSWTKQFMNTLEYASLCIQELKGAYGDFHSFEDQPLKIRNLRVHIDRDAAGVVGWREKDDPKRFYTTKQLAERYLKLVLERAHIFPKIGSTG